MDVHFQIRFFECENSFDAVETALGCMAAEDLAANPLLTELHSSLNSDEFQTYKKFETLVDEIYGLEKDPEDNEPWLASLTDIEKKINEILGCPALAENDIENTLLYLRLTTFEDVYDSGLEVGFLPEEIITQDFMIEMMLELEEAFEIEADTLGDFINSKRSQRDRTFYDYGIAKRDM